MRRWWEQGPRACIERWRRRRRDERRTPLLAHLEHRAADLLAVAHGPVDAAIIHDERIGVEPRALRAHELLELAALLGYVEGGSAGQKDREIRVRRRAADGVPDVVGDLLEQVVGV